MFAQPAYFRRLLGRFLRSPRVSSVQSGFTLLELLVVLVILSLLAAVGTVQVSGYLGRAKSQTAELQIRELGVALDLFRIDLGRYPSGEEGLDVLLSRPKNLDDWKGPYLGNADTLIDPWGEPFRYINPGENQHYDLISFGADRKKGGSGESADINNSIE